MCTACEEQRRRNGDPNEQCSRCGMLGEWATVIEMIQDRLVHAGSVERPVENATGGVAADPFSHG